MILLFCILRDISMISRMQDSMKCALVLIRIELWVAISRFGAVSRAQILSTTADCGAKVVGELELLPH